MNGGNYIDYVTTSKGFLELQNAFVEINKTTSKLYEETNEFWHELEDDIDEIQ
jgi:hypothetical protein